MNERRFRLGCDVGGTFTDFVLIDDATGEIVTHKTLTTPDNPARGIETGLGELLSSVHGTGSDVDIVIHGTTLVANALIERKGASTALIVTDGFRDILQMRTEMRYDIYDLFMRFPEPLVPRQRTYGLEERLDRDGFVLTPLDRAQLADIAIKLRDATVEAVGVCLLHAFRNPAHERLVRDTLQEFLPDTPVSLSSEVAPEIREFDRASTTAANAYVQPLAERYLGEASARLAGLGYERPLYLMLSGGGITTVETSGRFPIRLVESGPAGGVLAAAFHGRRAGISDMLSFDMGGTTAKACLIRNGEPAKTSAFEVARLQRFRKGSGLPVRVPTVDLIEIGAGGGSIAWVDDLGLLKVGPRSAGADPGPACYGFGGREATVTDADLVLGFLNPEYFLGGRMQLSKDTARQAMRRSVADPLGVSIETAADGIFRIVNENMVAAIKGHAVEHGVDPRNFTLLTYGGAGPVHAYEIARALKIPRIAIPPDAGAASAFGFLVAPTSFDLARSFIARLDRVDVADLMSVLAEMADEGRRVLLQAGVSADDIRLRRSLDLRHKGQGHEIVVVLEEDEALDADAIRTLFYREYRAIHGYAHEHLPVELITCHLTAYTPEHPMNLQPMAGSTDWQSAAYKGDRPAYLAESKRFAPVPVFDRYRLVPGAAFDGPAIVEEREATAVFGPSARIAVDDGGNLIATLDSAPHLSPTRERVPATKTGAASRGGS